MDGTLSSLPTMRLLNISEVNFVLGLLVVGLLVYICKVWNSARFGGGPRKLTGRRRTLPGPKSWPLIGSLFEIATVGQNCKNDNEFCRRLCQKYGPVLAFKVGVQNFVVVEDVEVGKQIFNSEDWCARVPSDPLFLEYFAHRQKLGIILNDGDDYKETRRFTLRCLKEFGFGQLQNMGNVIQDEVDHFITNFEAQHRQRLNANDGHSAGVDENNNGPEPFEDITLRYVFNLPSLNVLWNYLCGTRLECDDPFMQRLIANIQRASESVSYATKPMYAFPVLRFVPPGRADQQLLIKTFEDLRNIFKGIIDEKRKAGNYQSTQNDFIDMFLKNIDTAQEQQLNGDAVASKVYTKEQLIQTCVDLALGGSDTTGNAIEYSILYMLENPDVQRNVQREIDTVIGCQRRPNINDRHKMPYTEATILELLRCANITAFDFRTALRDTEVCGAILPKSTMALLNLAQIHNDKDLWGDPEKFRPSRFLSEDMEIVNTDKLYAFGGGKRLCIGKSMAKATLFIFFSTLLQRYTFEPSTKYPDFSTLSFTGGFTTRPDKFYCTVKPRASSYL